MCVSVKNHPPERVPSSFENDPKNDFLPKNWRGCSSSIDYAHHSVWRRRCAHHLDKKYSNRDSGGSGISLRRTRHTNYGSRHHSARNRHFAVGELLPMALPAVLGILVLLLGEQLCDSWIWRCGASVEVAPARPARKHGWHADVGSFNWTSLRGGHSPG